MKKFILAGGGLVLALVVAAGAQEGYEQIAMLAKGSYVQTYAYSVGTGANVALVPASRKRVDLTCRNNSAFTLYIGSNAATTTLTGVGFPILTNEVFELGAMSDTTYSIGSGGTVDVRCFEGLIR